MGGRIVNECGWGIGEGGLERWVSFRMIWRQVTSPCQFEELIGWQDFIGFTSYLRVLIGIERY